VDERWRRFFERNTRSIIVDGADFLLRRTVRSTGVQLTNVAASDVESHTIPTDGLYEVSCTVLAEDLQVNPVRFTLSMQNEIGASLWVDTGQVQASSTEIRFRPTRRFLRGGYKVVLRQDSTIAAGNEVQYAFNLDEILILAAWGNLTL
jgi:hypothetical protein